MFNVCFFFFSSRRRHTRSLRDWSSDVCSSDLSASHSWTDWPVRVSFLPVLQQAVSWLADALEQRQPAPSIVGGERSLSAPTGTRVETVLGPDGKPLPLRRENGHADDATVTLAVPGQYRALVAAPGVQPREEP